MRSESIVFPNARGEPLAAKLDLPIDGEPIAVALFAHCFTCSKNFKAVARLSEELTLAGIGVLRFDFTGLGESAGDFSTTHLSSNVADLLAAARFLTEHHGAAQLLIGHSLGGAAVLQAAAHLPTVKAVATIAAPFDPAHVFHLFADQIAQIQADGVAEVNIAGRAFRVRKEFLDDLVMADLSAAIARLKCALLVLHSPVDSVVPIDNAAKIFTAAKHPKSFVSLDQADHLLADAEDARYAGAVIAGWARKYVGAREQRPRPLADNRTIARIGASGYRTEILSNGHTLIADEPIAAGGTNTGPSPYELLLSALGACTVMTLRMYADRKRWPLREAVVRLRHRKIHAADCAECESKEGLIDAIEREIELVGDLSAEQRVRLGEIADRCPVHRTLHSEIVVRTQLRNPSINLE